MTNKQYYRNRAFQILQRHHSYLTRQPSGNLDINSEYVEDNIIDAMIEFGDLVRGHAENEHRKQKPQYP